MKKSFYIAVLFFLVGLMQVLDTQNVSASVWHKGVPKEMIGTWDGGTIKLKEVNGYQYSQNRYTFGKNSFNARSFTFDSNKKLINLEFVRVAHFSDIKYKVKGPKTYLLKFKPKGIVKGTPYFKLRIIKFKVYSKSELKIPQWYEGINHKYWRPYYKAR